MFVSLQDDSTTAGRVNIVRGVPQGPMMGPFNLLCFVWLGFEMRTALQCQWNQKYRTAVCLLDRILRENKDLLCFLNQYSLFVCEPDLHNNLLSSNFLLFQYLPEPLGIRCSVDIARVNVKL